MDYSCHRHKLIRHLRQPSIPANKVEVPAILHVVTNGYEVWLNAITVYVNDSFEYPFVSVFIEIFWRKDM